MIPYWLLFAYFAVGALLERDPLDRKPAGRSYFLEFGALIIALMIGFRFKVGADWTSYQQMFSYAGRVTATRIVQTLGDPGYELLNWVVQWLDGEIWHVNLVCGLIFAWGLARFARAQTNPWLAMTIAIPYLVTVVSMGYSRQGVAIGILMAGLASVIRGGSTLRFAAYVVAAATFHRTAVIVLPFVVLARQRNRLGNVLFGIALSVYLYDTFLSQSVARFYRNYVETEYSSQGAAIRIGLNLVPAIIFIVNRRKFDFSSEQAKLWTYFSLAAFASLVFLVISPSSTAVDRIALYIIPLQLAVLSRAHLAYRLGYIGRVMIVLASAAILFTWLNFAVYSRAWIPYRLAPIF